MREGERCVKSDFQQLLFCNEGKHEDVRITTVYCNACAMALLRGFLFSYTCYTCLMS